MSVAALQGVSVPCEILHQYSSRALCWQSLDSSCDIVCLKERIQKSQEEREKREERLLQTQTLQQTGNQLGRHAQTSCWDVSTRFWCLSPVSHGVKLEQLSLISHTDWRTLCLPSISSAFIVSFFRYGRRGGDYLLRRPDTFQHRPRLLLSGIHPKRGGPLSSV